MILPARRSCMLRGMSKALQKAVENARLAVQIKVKRGTHVARIADGLGNLLLWWLLAAVYLSEVSISAEGAGRLEQAGGGAPAVLVPRPPEP